MKPTLRQLRNAAILAGGLIAGAAGIRALTPEPFVQHVTPKLEHLRENPGAYDVLFVGSSRVYRQVIPKVFDRRMRRHGGELRSFNAGMPAARAVELWHFMRLLADAGVRARYVLVEPDGLFVAIHRQNLGAQRELYWHAAPETALAIRSLAGHEAVARLEMTGLHLAAFACKSLGVGRLRLLGLEALRGTGARRAMRGGLGPEGDGWVGFSDRRDGPAFPRRREFLSQLPAYRAQLEEQAGQLERSGCMTPYHEEMLLALASAARALGAEPIFILSPATRPRCEVHEAHRRGLIPNLLAFDDARVHPELFDPEARFDAEHLNTAGATLYSRLLADAVAELVGEGGP